MAVLIDKDPMLEPGMTVRILHPPYVIGETGKILSQEVVAEEEPSDYWLVQVNGEKMILALLAQEFQVIKQPAT